MWQKGTKNIPNYAFKQTIYRNMNTFVFADEMKPDPKGVVWRFSPGTSDRSFHSGGQSARNTPPLQQEPRWQSHIYLIPWKTLRPPHRRKVQTFWPRHTESSTPRAEHSAAWQQLDVEDVKEPAAFCCWFLDINWKTIINHIYNQCNPTTITHCSDQTSVDKITTESLNWSHETHSAWCVLLIGEVCWFKGKKC